MRRGAARRLFCRWLIHTGWPRESIRRGAALLWNERRVLDDADVLAARRGQVLVAQVAEDREGLLELVDELSEIAWPAALITPTGPGMIMAVAPNQFSLPSDRCRSAYHWDGVVLTTARSDNGGTIAWKKIRMGPWSRLELSQIALPDT